MKTRRRTAAFTFVEMLVALAIGAVVGLIAYGIASEGVISFARNISINRSYTNARQTVARIANVMQSAGHIPQLIDATGADNNVSPAAGIRFWQYSSTPLYYINTPVLTDTSLTLSLVKPGTTSTAIPAPSVGDMVSISLIGFQARATAVSVVGTTAVVSFSGTVVSNVPTTVPSTSITSAISGATANSGKMSCLVWTSVAFIDINNQLRYFSRFISGTTSVSTASNYRVVAYLTAALGTTTTPLPFSLGPPPSINIDLYVEAPDYNNRNSTVNAVASTSNNYNGISSADTYTYLQTAISPRNSGLLNTPY